MSLTVACHCPRVAAAKFCRCRECTLAAADTTWLWQPQSQPSHSHNPATVTTELRQPQSQPSHSHNLALASADITRLWQLRTQETVLQRQSQFYNNKAACHFCTAAEANRGVTASCRLFCSCKHLSLKKKREAFCRCEVDFAAVKLFPVLAAAKVEVVAAKFRFEAADL